MSSNRLSNVNPLTKPEFMPLSILRTVWKGKFLVLAIMLVVSVATVVAVRRIPSVYNAQALVLVDSQKIPNDYVSTTVRVSVQDRLASISRHVLSTERLKGLIRDLNLYPGLGKNIPDGLVDAMRTKIVIGTDPSYSGGLSAFRVGYTGENPRLVADVANRLASFFVEENLKEREVQAEGTAEFIDSQLKDAKSKLDRLENAVTQYKLLHSGELPQQQTALLGGMGRLQSELQVNAGAIERAKQNKLVLESSLDLATTTLNSLQTNWESTLRAAQQAAAQNDTPKTTVAPLVAPPVAVAPKENPEIEKLEAQLTDLRLRYSDEHPDVKRTKARLDRLVQLEAQQQARALQTAPAPVQSAPPVQTSPTPRPQPQRPVTAREPVELAQTRERIQSIRAQILSATREIETRSADERKLRAEMGTLQGRIDRLPLREQEMAQVMRDLQVSQKNYEVLLSKKLSADMATDLERRQKAERFTIVDPARTPTVPFKPNRRMLYLMGIGAGLLLGVGAAFGNEMRKGVLLGDWEFPANTVVLGALPRIEITASGVATSQTHMTRWLLFLAIPLIAAAIFFLRQKLL